MTSYVLILMVIAKVIVCIEASNITFEDGSTYLGDIDEVNDVPNGFGKLLFANGDIYE